MKNNMMKTNDAPLERVPRKMLPAGDSLASCSTEQILWGMPEEMMDGEPPDDPRPTVAEEIEQLRIIKEYIRKSFDGKLVRCDWEIVNAALDSDVEEVKALATDIFTEMILRGSDD